MITPQHDRPCMPGDITVTKIPTGFLIGRALRKKGPGPWWEYITIVVSFHQASLRAHRLAKSAGVRAWLHISADEYQPLPKWERKPRRRPRRH